MDQRTAKTLRGITARTPRRLVNSLMKQVVDTAEEDMVKDMLRSGQVTNAKRRKLERLLALGAFRRTEVIADEDVIKELDRYNKMQVDKARRQGKLANPETDAFYRNRMAKIAKMKKNST